MWRRRRAADRSAAGFFHFNLKTSGQSDLEITAALGIVPVLYNGLACVPLTGAPFRGDLDPNLVQGSLGPHESASQTASQLVQPFCTVYQYAQYTQTLLRAMCRKGLDLRTVCRQCG